MSLSSFLLPSFGLRAGASAVLLVCAVCLTVPRAYAEEPAPEKRAIPVLTAEGRGPHLVARLLADQTAVRPGAMLQLGVRLKMDEHWHVYWRQAGDAGLPPVLTWTLPPGFRAGPLQWPAPRRHVTGPLVTYTYDDEVLLPISVQVPFDFRGTSATFRVQVDWLVCEDSQGCIPGEALLELTLPLTAGEPAPALAAELFARTRAQLPRATPQGATLSAGAHRATLLLEGPGPWHAADAELDLYWATWEVFDPTGVPRVTRAGDRTTLQMDYASGQDAPTALDALLVVAHGETRYTYRVQWGPRDAPPGRPQNATTPGAAESPAPSSGETACDPIDASVLEDDLSWAATYVDLDARNGNTPSSADRSLLSALVLAFLGGLILNVMPCVLPVLSLKILSFVDQADGSPVQTRRHGYAFAIGVIGSFLLVAGLLLYLRHKGSEVGWGFQLQEPAVVVGLAVLMFTLGLNLAGLFEIGTSLTSLAGRASHLSEGKGYMSSVWMGALATVIATPCTAPFMGPAIGYALTQPALASLAVFGLIGVGMSAPYVVLAVMPKLLRFLPRPGPWMVTFKQLMAFPMFATVVWLVWVYGRQVGADGVVVLLAGLLLVAMGAWLYGRFSLPARSARTRWIIGRGLALALFAGGVVMGVRHDAPEGTGSAARVATAPEGWVPYDGHQIVAAQAAGQPVFLDFTADWCLTCKANEAAFLETEAVRDAFRRYDVVPMQADWTRRDERITNALSKLDRSSVPLYVLVPADPDQPAVVLRTAITKSYIVKAMDEVLGPGAQ